MLPDQWSLPLPNLVLKGLVLGLLFAYGFLTIARPAPKPQKRSLGPPCAFVAAAFALATAAFSALSLSTAWRLYTYRNTVAGRVGKGLEILPSWVRRLVENDLFGTSPFLWLLWYPADSVWLVYGVAGLVAAICAYGLWCREELTRIIVMASLYACFCYTAALLSLLVAAGPGPIHLPLVAAFLTYGLLIRQLATEQLQHLFSANRRFLHPLLVVGIPPLTFALTLLALVMEGLRGLR